MAAGVAFSRVAAVFSRFRRAGVPAAAPLKFKTGNIPAAANTPCRGRFHIGPACPAADPCGRAVALPCKPGQTLRLPGLPEAQNFPVGAGFIPPAEPCAAANTPGRCEHRPLHGFAMAAGVAFSRVAAVFPRFRRAGVHARRTVEIQNREHSRRRGARRDEGIPPYVRPGGRGNPIWPVVPGRHVGEGHAPPANPAPPQTPHVGADSISARPALPRTPAGGPWPPCKPGQTLRRPVCLKRKICP